MATATIDSVITPGGGRIGMVPCPGRSESGGLAAELDAVRRWGAVMVVTLMEGGEREGIGPPGIGPQVEARGMGWRHLPIRDLGVPGPAFERCWADTGAELRARLRGGGRIVLHCWGGLGRSGTVAARLLVEMGATPDGAIDAVRSARRGAIETPAQEEHVRATRVPER